MKAAAERSGFAPVKNAEVYGSLAAASFVFKLFFVALYSCLLLYRRS